MLKKTLLAGLAALTLGGGLSVSTTSASAQVVYGPAYGYGYRPVYYGPRYGYRHRGGAVAAGIVGGLALGALAASAAARPTYVYGECWTERRRVVNAWGDVYVRRVRVCN